MRLIIAGLVVLALSPAARADDAQIRAAIHGMKPTVSSISILPTALPSLREVHVDNEIVYTSPDGRFMLVGDLYDTKAKHDLTTDAHALVAKRELATSPASTHIRFAPAKPLYTVYVFTDSSCGYCRKFHSQIAEYNKLGIAVEYLAYPRNGLEDVSAKQLTNAFCAADKRTALTLVKNDKPVAPANPNCKSPVPAQYALGQRLNLHGTPGIFAADGRQLGGYLPPADLLQALKGG